MKIDLKILTIYKPHKTIVPLAVGRSWNMPGCYQVKEDGCFAVRDIGGGTIAGEAMRGGNFISFDLLWLGGEDVRGWPLRERWRALNGLRGAIQAAGGEIVATGHGGEFLEAVIAGGGEGVVFKPWDSIYGEMLACKRVETFLCRVTDTGGGKQSVGLEDAATKQPRGRCSLFGGRIDKIQVGSILKIEGYGITADGLIREPRPCKDTPDSWLVQY